MIIGEITTSGAEWSSRFYRLAEEIASWSKDPICKVGSIVVSADRRQFSPGYNGFPRGTPDLKQSLTDPQVRLSLMVHSEVNAIVNAPFDVAGAWLYTTKYPCAACAGVIANARIARLVCPAPDYDSSWGDSFRFASSIFADLGLDISIVEDAS